MRERTEQKRKSTMAIIALVVGNLVSHMLPLFHCELDPMMRMVDQTAIIQKHNRHRNKVKQDKNCVYNAATLMSFSEHCDHKKLGPFSRDGNKHTHCNNSQLPTNSKRNRYTKSTGEFTILELYPATVRV